MSRERIVVGAGLWFLSGVVLSQPPHVWVELFSLSPLLARWADAVVVGCTGLWLGVAWAVRHDAAFSDKVNKLEGQVTLLTQQMTGVNNGMVQIGNAINEHTKQLMAMQAPVPAPKAAAPAVMQKPG